MGFKLTKIEEIQATGAYYAKIEQDGEIVGDVENRGNGGAPYFHFETREAEAAYAAAAAEVLPGYNTEMFTEYLMSLAEINRKRSIIAVKSITELAMTGVYYTVRTPDFEQAKASAHRQNMLVWDKQAYAFV